MKFFLILVVWLVGVFQVVGGIADKKVSSFDLEGIGRYSDGTVITKSDLKKILEEHEKWLKSARDFKKLQKITDEKFFEYETLKKLNEWRKAEGKNGTRAILNKVIFKNTTMYEANLEGADLKEGTFEKVLMYGVNFKMADLEEAICFKGEWLPKSCFRHSVPPERIPLSLVNPYLFWAAD